MNQTIPVLQALGIDKSFSGAKVLDAVDFTIYPGEVHGLMGENGAGKSTLIKIITGIYPKDAGQLYIDGKPVEIHSRNDAARYGISVIYQELSLISNLTVTQNIFLGQEQTSKGFLKRKEMRKRIVELIEEYKFDLDPDALVESLSLAKRQTVEILKALLVNSKIIIMDEPTTSITTKETEILFSIIKRLRDAGTSIIYISHRLDEINLLVNRLTVLRDGKVVGVLNDDECDPIEIIRLMLGKNLEMEGKVFHPAQEDVDTLEVKHLSTNVLGDVSFTARAGQILGIGGLVGSGRSELLHAIFGLDKYTDGEILYNGRPVDKSVVKNIRGGIGLIPEDRRSQGFVPLLPIKENIVMASYDKVSIGGFLVNQKAIDKAAKHSVEEMDIRPPNPDLCTINLSGGNQQKVVVGKWLMRDLKVLLVDEPTVGIDVGAKSAIYEILEGLAAKGVIVVMVSSDLRELVTVADRILVMYRGQVFKEFDNVDITQEDVLVAASGIDKEVGVE